MQRNSFGKQNLLLRIYWPKQTDVSKLDEQIIDNICTLYVEFVGLLCNKS